MHVVVMGCGRVGSILARSLQHLGHSVAVVDQEATSFRRLGPDFSGVTVTGMGFDRDVLLEAGIEKAGGFAAVSSGDNSNIISARVARETFGVENVVARIYDPRRAEVYQRLGIPTVATVRWAADSVLRRLLPEGAQTLWRDPSGALALVEVHFDPAWIGTLLSVVEDATQARVPFLTRYGAGMLPDAATVLQEGDLLHLTLPVTRVGEAAEVLRVPPADGGR